MLTTKKPTEFKTLLGEATGGDDFALAQLLWRHYDRLANFIRPLIPTDIRAHVDTDDLIQDTFTIIWKKITEVDIQNEQSFHAWARAILRRKLLDHIRAANCRKRAHRTEPDSEAKLSLLESRTSLDRVLVSEREERLNAAIEKLNRRQRQAIDLRFLKQRTIAEVAQELDCTPGALHMVTRRALDRLRKELTDEPE